MCGKNGLHTANRATQRPYFDAEIAQRRKASTQFKRRLPRETISPSRSRTSFIFSDGEGALHSSPLAPLLSLMQSGLEKGKGRNFEKLFFARDHYFPFHFAAAVSVALGRRLNRFLGFSLNDRPILFLVILLDKAVPVG